MRPYTFKSVLLSIVFIFALYTSLIDGYVVKRFVDSDAFPRLRLFNSIDEFSPLPLVVADTGRSQSKRYVPTDEEIQAALDRIRNSEAKREMSQTYAKKSHKFGYKSTKTFNNSGSRNCFFSPVQCLVKFDLSKYKKLVDSSGMRRFRPLE